MTVNGVLFTKEELSEFKLLQLRNIATYLEIKYEPKTSRDKLIQLILSYQGPSQPYLGGADVVQNPIYSVRVQRIMDMKEKGMLP